MNSLRTQLQQALEFYWRCGDVIQLNQVRICPKPGTLIDLYAGGLPSETLYYIPPTRKGQDERIDLSGGVLVLSNSLGNPHSARSIKIAAARGAS